MKKKTVFLVGDIGSNSKGYFHVGDEAMWVANVENYLSQGWNVIATSRDPNDCYRQVKLISDVVIKDIDRYRKLTTDEGEDNDIHLAIRNSNLIHISGGGNVNNLWIGHFYYRCYILYLAHKYGKPVVITSQTVGPLDDEQLDILGKYTKNVIHFGLRDNYSSVDLVKRAGFSESIIYVGPDDAMNFMDDQMTEEKEYLSISVHKDDVKSPSISKLISMETKKCVIPHVFDNHYYEGKELSIDTCATIQSQMTKDAKIKCILNMTKQSKLVVATRYHAAVFALMMQIPTVIFYRDEYYKTKFLGLLDYFELDSSLMLYPLGSDLLNTQIDDIQNEFKKHLNIEKILHKNKIYRKRLYETIEQYTA